MWLAEAGAFPDASSLANIQPPAGYGPNGWAGSDFTVLAAGSPCVANTWFAGVGAIYLLGEFCPAIRLTDGVTLSECVQSLNKLRVPGVRPADHDLRRLRSDVLQHLRLRCRSRSGQLGLQR